MEIVNRTIYVQGLVLNLFLPAVLINKISLVYGRMYGAMGFIDVCNWLYYIILYLR